MVKSAVLSLREFSTYDCYTLPGGLPNRPTIDRRFLAPMVTGIMPAFFNSSETSSPTMRGLSFIGLFGKTARRLRRAPFTLTLKKLANELHVDQR
jgi:hypothetical protein